MPMAMPSPTHVRPFRWSRASATLRANSAIAISGSSHAVVFRMFRKFCALASPGESATLMATSLLAGSLSNTLRPVDFNLVTTRLRRSVRSSVISPLWVFTCWSPAREGLHHLLVGDAQDLLPRLRELIARDDRPRDPFDEAIGRLIDGPRQEGHLLGQRRAEAGVEVRRGLELASRPCRSGRSGRRHCRRAGRAARRIGRCSGPGCAPRWRPPRRRPGGRRAPARSPRTSASRRRRLGASPRGRWDRWGLVAARRYRSGP